MPEKWDPNWVVSPGETLLDWMEENGLVVNERPLVPLMAKVCSLTPKELQGILEGKLHIGTVRAAKLAVGTRIPARLWLNLERQFRQGLGEGKIWTTGN